MPEKCLATIQHKSLITNYITMQKTTQSSRDAQKEINMYKADLEIYEKLNWKLKLENDNLYTRIAILSMTTLVSVIGVLILFFSR